MSGKKIGILTLPLNNNFGGILQSYALQLYLKNKGNEVVLIDRRHNQSSLDPYKLLLKKYFFKGKYKEYIEANVKISENTRYFRHKYILPKTNEIYSEKELKNIVDEQSFDAVIVGSDQVWRLEYATDLVKNMFLDFVPSSAKRISYAASFGVGSWEHNSETTDIVKDLVKKFDRISVREDSGLEICNEVFGVNATQLVDPTMLLDTSDYIKLVEGEAEPKREGEILTYMLDNSEERKKLVKIIQGEIGGDIFNINVKSKKSADPLEERIFPTVTSWLRGFIDAKFAIVDSFHGCVFAILFNKPFIAFGNKERGLTRFSSLLKLFKLEDRLILSSEELTTKVINAPIDWELTNSILKDCRKVSEKYFDEM